MPNIFVLETDKTLSKRSSTINRQGEHNAETVNFLIPPKFNGYEVKNCNVTISITKPNGEKLIKPIYHNAELYKGYLVYPLRISMDITQIPGKIGIVLEITRSGLNIISGTGYIDIIS